MDAKKQIEQVAQGLGHVRLAAPEIAQILLYLHDITQLLNGHAHRLWTQGDAESALLFAKLAILGDRLPGGTGGQHVKEAQLICDLSNDQPAPPLPPTPVPSFLIRDQKETDPRPAPEPSKLAAMVL